jgi:hypothetical protein
MFVFYTLRTIRIIGKHNRQISRFELVALVARAICKFGSSPQKMVESFTIQPPSHIIPEEYRRDSRSDGSDIRTVRLPNYCLNCGAALSHEGIDWVDYGINM